MARDESSREDLLREATALVERAEIVPADSSTPIVIGFRSNGALSVFFGEDPVYQFNAAGELRRAFRNGLMLKAVDGQLVSLCRLRTEHEVQLVRRTLTAAEQQALIADMQNSLRSLSDLIAAGVFRLTGQVPSDANVIGRFQEWLASRITWPIASRPNA